MTRLQVVRLLKDWAEYQCGSVDARIGPRDYSKPLMDSDTHDVPFFHEYQFVQKAIEDYYSKAFDRSMIVAILISWVYYAESLQSRVMCKDCQGEAIERFIDHMVSLEFKRPVEKIAEIA